MDDWRTETEPCSHCKGSGVVPKACPLCGGSGHVSEFRLRGSGRTAAMDYIQKPCPNGCKSNIQVYI